MLARLGRTFGALAAIVTASITEECMMTSDEFGDAGRTDVEFVSNMKDVVGVGEQIMFMRTVDLFVCSSAQRIHGIRVSLRHDPQKDPAHNEYLDTFYSHTIAPDHDRTWYSTMLGEQDGECEYVYVNEHEKIESVIVHHDDRMIRVMEFKMSTDRIQKVGMWTGLMDDLEHEFINFTHGEEIVGIFGKIAEHTSTNMAGTKNTSKNFVSLGFIVNQCENFKLSRFSSDVSRQKMKDHHDPNSDIYKVYEVTEVTVTDQGEDVTVLTAAVVVLSIMTCLTCGYILLKNRGKMCKKKKSEYSSPRGSDRQQTSSKKSFAHERVNGSSFQSVEITNNAFASAMGTDMQI